MKWPVAAVFPVFVRGWAVVAKGVAKRAPRRGIRQARLLRHLDRLRLPFG